MVRKTPSGLELAAISLDRVAGMESARRIEGRLFRMREYVVSAIRVPGRSLKGAEIHDVRERTNDPDRTLSEACVE
jgi:hypothetical protein